MLVLIKAKVSSWEDIHLEQHVLITLFKVIHSTTRQQCWWAAMLAIRTLLTTRSHCLPLVLNLMEVWVVLDTYIIQLSQVILGLLKTVVSTVRLTLRRSQLSSSKEQTTQIFARASRFQVTFTQVKLQKNMLCHWLESRFLPSSTSKLASTKVILSRNYKLDSHILVTISWNQWLMLSSLLAKEIPLKTLRRHGAKKLRKRSLESRAKPT